MTRRLRGMASLELLVITSFALVAIFAVVPVVLQQIYQYQALAEARAGLAFLNALADSVESDMGAAYAQKVLNLPTFRLGGAGLLHAGGRQLRRHAGVQHHVDLQVAVSFAVWSV